MNGSDIIYDMYDMFIYTFTVCMPLKTLPIVPSPAAHCSTSHGEPPRYGDAEAPATWRGRLVTNCLRSDFFGEKHGGKWRKCVVKMDDHGNSRSIEYMYYSVLYTYYAYTYSIIFIFSMYHINPHTWIYDDI
jgi:hypothetical protein